MRNGKYVRRSYIRALPRKAFDRKAVITFLVALSRLKGGVGSLTGSIKAIFLQEFGQFVRLPR